MLSTVYTLAFELSFYPITESVLELREAIILIFVTFPGNFNEFRKQLVFQ